MTASSIFADPTTFAAAPCTRQDPDLAFDAPEVMATICNTECPVATTWACLRWAVETDTIDGVFGGLTGEQRREIIRTALKPDKPRREIRADQHGTRTGYNYYGCRCDECREAHNAYKRARYRAARVRYRAEGVPSGWHAQKGGDA